MVLQKGHGPAEGPLLMRGPFINSCILFILFKLN